MGKKSNQEQHERTQLNDYERSRMLRVKENQERLRELGVKNIAMSLTSLAESKKTNKRKGKPNITKERDADYTPDVGGDSEEDYLEEFAINKRVPKKQHRTQFIAPMSMTRYANLAKQKRVVAPNMSHMLPFEERCNQNGQFFDTNVTTKSRLQQSEKSFEGYRNSRNLNASKHSKSSEAFTMGELILKKKKSQREIGVLKQNLEKANSITTSISCGARRKLTYVDDDDDMEDDIRSQAESLGLQDHVAAEDNEDMDNMIFGNIQNRIERNGISSQGKSVSYFV